MNHSRRGGYSFQRASRTSDDILPPGAIGSVSSTTAAYTTASLAELKNAPARRNMPHLHPEKLNGTLWFDIHPQVTKDIRKTWKANFWGPWWNFRMVPQEKKNMWWSSFVQQYCWDDVHEAAVFSAWEEHCKGSISSRVSQRKLAGNKPEYISDNDWDHMLQIWETEQSIKKCKKNSLNRKANPHFHTVGAKKIVRIEHEMTVAAGGVRPSITALVKETHTKKDGTFVDKRAEKFVKTAMSLAMERCTNETNVGETGSTLVVPSSHQLTAAYLETATNSKGRIYGLGSLQYFNADPGVPPATSFARNLAVDERITMMEETVSSMKKSMEENNETFRRATNMLLRVNGIDPVTLMPITTAPPATRSNGSSSTGAQSDSHIPVNLADLPNQNLPGIFEEVNE